jgi:hypothetical protein
MYMNTIYKNSGIWLKDQPKNSQEEEGAEIKNKGIENLFNEIIAENFPDPCNNINTHVQEAFWTPNTNDQRKQPHYI